MLDAITNHWKTSYYHVEGIWKLNSKYLAYCIFNLSSSCFARLAFISSSVSAFLFLSCKDGELLAFTGDLFFPFSEGSISASEPELCDFLGDLWTDDVDGCGEVTLVSDSFCLPSGENSSLFIVKTPQFTYYNSKTGKYYLWTSETSKRFIFHRIRNSVRFSRLGDPVSY